MIMKRITALLLALVMCFALCACGSTPDPNLKEEDLAGTWSPSLWFLSTQLKLNSDGTYDYGEEKGKCSNCALAESIRHPKYKAESFRLRFVFG